MVLNKMEAQTNKEIEADMLNESRFFKTRQNGFATEGSQENEFYDSTLEGPMQPLLLTRVDNVRMSLQ